MIRGGLREIIYSAPGQSAVQHNIPDAVKKIHIKEKRAVFWMYLKLNTDFLITSYIFSYLLISPRNPVNQGFVDISLLVDTSRIFLYLYYRDTSNVVKK